MKNDEPLLIEGKTIEEWDQEWRPIAGGLRISRPELRYVVGLYRCSFGGQISALGTGTDRRKAMEKRFYDFRRTGDSGRRYYAGQKVHEHLDQLEVEILKTGPNVEHAREIARKLRTPMIRRHRPIWTAHEGRYSRK